MSLGMVTVKQWPFMPRHAIRRMGLCGGQKQHVSPRAKNDTPPRGMGARRMKEADIRDEKVEITMGEFFLIFKNFPPNVA